MTREQLKKEIEELSTELDAVERLIDAGKFDEVAQRMFGNERGNIDEGEGK